MCQIRILVIGNSFQRNRDSIMRVHCEAASWDKDVEIDAMEIGPFSQDVVNLDDYDLAVVDEDVITRECSRTVLGSGLPVLEFRDMDNSISSDTMSTISRVIKAAIDEGNLREHIIKATKEINATHRMIASS